MAITCFLGVTTVKGMGLGLMICCRLFLLEGAGVGGKGVGAGEGAPVWLMTTGSWKS